MVENLSANAGGDGLIPGLGRSPGVGNDSLLQYSHLENSMVEERVRGVSKESDTTEPHKHD